MKKRNLILLILLFIFIYLTGCVTNNPVTYINIEDENIVLNIGESYSININYDGIGDYTDLKFEVSEENKLIVDNNYIEAIDSGIVILTVKSKNSNQLVSDSIQITIYDENEKAEFVRVSAPTNALIVGNSMDVYVDNIKSLNVTGNEDFNFSVSDETILKLNENYTVTALKNGICEVIATQKDKPLNVGKFTIYVGLQSDDKTKKNEPNNTPLVAFFDDDNFTIDASVDEQINLLGATNYQRYHFTPSDENILLISDTGLFMGVQPGTVEVKITSKDSSKKDGKDIIYDTNTTLKITVTGERKRDYIPKLLAIALAEQGYVEGPLPNQTKYGEWNNCNFEAWCATFVSWCLNNAGIPKSIAIRSCSVRVFETTYRSKNQFYLKGQYQPQPGDFIIFSSAGASHIGIVVSSDNSKVYTIEGNTSGMVAQRTYDLNHETITGYIKPNYNE